MGAEGLAGSVGKKGKRKFNLGNIFDYYRTHLRVEKKKENIKKKVVVLT